jgi:hypothetical protein
VTDAPNQLVSFSEQILEEGLIEQKPLVAKFRNKSNQFQNLTTRKKCAQQSVHALGILP